MTTGGNFNKEYFNGFSIILYFPDYFDLRNILIFKITIKHKEVITYIGYVTYKEIDMQKNKCFAPNSSATCNPGLLISDWHFFPSRQYWLFYNCITILNKEMVILPKEKNVTLLGGF